MMTKINRKILQVLLLINILSTAVIMALFKKEYIYAFEIGFISSTVVIIASLLAYRRMVNTRVEHNVITFDDSKDVIDILEDPYDLYSEDKPESKDEKDLVAVVKEEQENLKNSSRSLFEILRDTKAALSAYRLGGYVILILGFLYLNRQGLLHIPTYIIALGLPPMIIVGLLVQDKTTLTEEKENL